MKSRHPLIGTRLGECEVQEVIGGTPIYFDRRRYSNQNFVWVSAWIGGRWCCLGDPWPGIRPRLGELVAAIASEIDRQRAAAR
jgi:hypothetical protein